MNYTVILDSAAADFYREIAEAAGKSTEQVLSDALERFAGLLSAAALANRDPPQHTYF